MIIAEAKEKSMVYTEATKQDFERVVRIECILKDSKVHLERRVEGRFFNIYRKDKVKGDKLLISYDTLEKEITVNYL